MSNVNIYRPLLIAGPCSAESEEQVMNTARAIKEFSSSFIFRAGVWKPRTRPNSFEGMGESALPWLTRVQQELKVPVITEVANTRHVELCLKAGLKKVWIGARTTVNPFAVQEICDALRGTGCHIYVKNPVNPDLSLWMGGIERALNSGAGDVKAIFRGFQEYSPGIYRNVPSWEIVVELKRRMPELDIICDPSHICGKASLVSEVAQRAMDMGLSGLMIETHPHPSLALSDAEQQVTPDQLKAILNGLRVFVPNSANEQFNSKLVALRKRIDHLDNELLRLLSERVRISAEIGHDKKEQGVTILQIDRYDEMMKRLKTDAAKLGLDEALVHELFSVIHKNSIEIQERILKK